MYTSGGTSLSEPEKVRLPSALRARRKGTSGKDMFFRFVSFFGCRLLFWDFGVFGVVVHTFGAPHVILYL